MGWQERVKKQKKEEIDKVITKEEKLQLKEEKKIKKLAVKKEINEPIKKIDERVYKSNINLLFLIFRPILFIIAGLLIMMIKKDYSFVANQNLWPLVFLIINILTIILLTILMRMQRISYKNILKYSEKKFKWWQFILIILGLLLSFVIGSSIAEFIAYGTFMEKASLLTQSYNKILDYFLLILLPLTTILAEDMFFFGYILNTVKDKHFNYILIAILTTVQHGFFPFSFDLVFIGYRILSSFILFGAYTFLYKKTKNLWPIIVSHVILNFVTMIAIVLP